MLMAQGSAQMGRKHARKDEQLSSDRWPEATQFGVRW